MFGVLRRKAAASGVCTASAFAKSLCAPKHAVSANITGEKVMCNARGISHLPKNFHVGLPGHGMTSRPTREAYQPEAAMQIQTRYFFSRIVDSNALAKKAKDGSISIDEKSGVTFTISNAGVYRSLSSTPTTAESTTENRQTMLRPLSPHLPIYKPQVTSTFSILNRISGVFLTTIVLSFYLVYLKMGLICFTYEPFYQFLFYSSKLFVISVEMSALALSYHVYKGVRHLLADFSGSLSVIKRLK